MNFIRFCGIRYISMLRQECYVGGKWKSAISGNKFAVINPATSEVIGRVPDMNEEDTANAIDSAYEAFQIWEFTTAKERSGILRNWFNLVEENKEDLSVLLTLESGKPLSESRGEITYGSSFIEWFAEEGKRIYGEVAQSPSSSKEMVFIRQPIGVAGLITPWNFPNAMITRKACAAIAAGCTCVVKPAEDTPLSALALADLAEKAGVPSGVFNVITCSRDNASGVGNMLCTSKKVSGISFTGSTAVGKLLYKQCADGIKRIGLELGGNAAFIVFNSANLKVTIDSLMMAKFRNAGQTCISANRFLVQCEIYDKFVSSLATAMKSQLCLGNGLQGGVNQGPLINMNQRHKVEKIVNDSIAMGAKALMGGKKSSVGELYFEPTILLDVTNDMPCIKEEIFGPVVSVMKSVLRVSKKLECGMVGVNEGLISAAEAAFGGIKESGIGREGSRHGIDDYTYIKYICIGGLK